MNPFDLIHRYAMVPRQFRKVCPDWKERVAKNQELLESARLVEHVSDRLSRLVIHAAGTSAYWRRRFDDAGIDPYTVRSIHELRSLPLLEKSDVRDHLEEMSSSAIALADRLPDMTGGSTAAPMRFYRDPECLAERVALEWVTFGWYGRKPHHRWGHVWGAQRDLGRSHNWRSRLRKRIVEGAIVLPANQLEPGLIDVFLREMRSFRPRFLHAYSQGLYLLARYVLETGQSVPDVKAATVTAEPISAQQKSIIDLAFSCRTFAIYGTREFGMIGAEVPNEQGLHINPLNAILEFIGPDGERVAPGSPGQVVVTDLLNLATPLIRYRIGDIGIPLADARAEADVIQRMEILEGRETDFVVTDDGRFVSGAGLTLVSADGIAQLQYIQERVHELRVRYVPAVGFSPESLKFIESQLRDAVGDSMVISFEQVNDIPPLPSGKIRYVYSEVARQKLSLQPCQIS